MIAYYESEGETYCCMCACKTAVDHFEMIYCPACTRCNGCNSIASQCDCEACVTCLNVPSECSCWGNRPRPATAFVTPNALPIKVTRAEAVIISSVVNALTDSDSIDIKHQDLRDFNPIEEYPDRAEAALRRLP